MVPRERRMLSDGCDAPMGDERCRSIVWQRCLPTGANKVGISHRGGLRTGRKRRRTENDDKQLNDVSGPSGRHDARFNSEVRGLGTIDGRHVASPIPAGSLNPTCNEGRTVAGRDQARDQPVDSIGVWLLRNNLPQARCRLTGLLLALSRHPNALSRCPLSGVKRTPSNITECPIMTRSGHAHPAALSHYLSTGIRHCRQ